MGTQMDYLAHHGILGMKWGIRRYQNKDGSLTEAGKKRYDRDIRENNAKKKDNRIDVSNPDPKRWVKEDLKRTKDLVDETSKLTEDIQRTYEKSTVKPEKKRPDLTKMSDQDLKKLIDREMLERRYTDLFVKESDSYAEKGEKYVMSSLDLTNVVLGIASSALGIAVLIKELKG